MLASSNFNPGIWFALVYFQLHFQVCFCKYNGQKLIPFVSENSPKYKIQNFLQNFRKTVEHFEKNKTDFSQKSQVILSSHYSCPNWPLGIKKAMATDPSMFGKTPSQLMAVQNFFSDTTKAATSFFFKRMSAANLTSLQYFHFFLP